MTEAAATAAGLVNLVAPFQIVANFTSGRLRHPFQGDTHMAILFLYPNDLTSLDLPYRHDMHRHYLLNEHYRNFIGHLATVEFAEPVEFQLSFLPRCLS